MSRNDIYTRAPIQTRSEEHVLQAALGGRLVSKELIDKSTNDRFGHTIDAALERTFRHLRLMMGVESAGGRPPTEAIVAGEDGHRYRIGSGGSLEVVPSGKIEFSEGTYRLEAVVGSEADLRQMLRKKAKESGHDLDALVKKALALGKTRREPSPVVNFELNGLGGETFRATAKTACNLLAHYDRDLFLSPGFDPVRAFVLQEAGQDEWDSYAYPTPFEVGEGIGEVDHLVRIERQSSGEVLGLVVYFGYLATLIRLGTTAHSFVSRSYRVDPIDKQQRIDDQRDLQLPLPAWEPVGTMAGYTETLLAQVRRLIPVAQRIQHGIWIGSIIGPFVRQLETEEKLNGGPLDEARVRQVVGELTSALIDELEPSIAAAAERRKSQASPESI